MKILTREAQLDGNNAVLGFAQPTTRRLPDAGRLVTFFRVPGFVEALNDMENLMLSGDELIEPFIQAIPIPAALAEKFLQGAWRDASVKRNRLQALFQEVRKLTFHLYARMRQWVPRIEAVVKVIIVLGELRLQLTNLGRLPCLGLQKSLTRHSFSSKRN